MNGIAFSDIGIYFIQVIKGPNSGNAYLKVD